MQWRRLGVISRQLAPSQVHATNVLILEPTAATDPSPAALWSAVQNEAQTFLQNDSDLKAILHEHVFSRGSLAEACASILASKLHDNEMSADQLFKLFAPVLQGSTISALASDLHEVRRRDPACHWLLVPLLFFKGFQAVQTYRISHVFWTTGRQGTALWLQSRNSEIFGVDVHPGAVLGPGTIFDHATGIVIGETARVGKQCLIFHQVTLGASGAPVKGPRRHPIIGDDCVLGAGCKVLGCIVLGDRVKVGGNSVVVTDVPSDTVAVGVPSRIVGRSATALQPTQGGALLTTDTDGRVLSWNFLAAKMFGYTEREALGQNVSNLIIPSPHRELHAGYMNAYLTGKPAGVVGKVRKVRARKKDGSEFEVNLCLSEYSFGAKHVFEAVLFESGDDKKPIMEVEDYTI